MDTTNWTSEETFHDQYLKGLPAKNSFKKNSWKVIRIESEFIVYIATS